MRLSLKKTINMSACRMKVIYSTVNYNTQFRICVTKRTYVAYNPFFECIYDIDVHL